MIVILIVVLTLARLEQEITSDHLEDGASQTPYVSTGVIVGPNDDLRGSVLPGLNLRCEVVMGIASIAHITNLNHDIVANLGSTIRALVFLLGHLLLHELLLVLGQKPMEIGGNTISTIHASLLGMLRFLGGCSGILA